MELFTIFLRIFSDYFASVYIKSDLPKTRDVPGPVSGPI